MTHVIHFWFDVSIIWQNRNLHKLQFCINFFAFSLLQLPNKTYFHSTTHYVWVKNEKVRIMSNAPWLVGPFPFLFHFYSRIFQYQSITHGLWFIEEKKTHDNHAKLQFMNGSNFVKLSKRMHIRPHDKSYFEWILSNFIDGPVDTFGILMIWACIKSDSWKNRKVELLSASFSKSYRTPTRQFLA